MDYGSITFGGDARRAHLALIEGGASLGSAAAGAATRASSARTLRPTAAPTASSAATGYRAASAEAPRSRHESGVRAVARTYDNFEDALLPMVRASGVSGSREAETVAEAIRNNPALKAQAERAFQRARISAV